MIYLRVAHTDQQLDEEVNDCDLFSFFDALTALRYIRQENLSNWIMSDIILEEYQPEDYTYIALPLY